MNPRFRVVTLCFGLMLSYLCAAPATPAETKPTVANAKLEDFAFISGHNRGEYDGGVIDEHWSEPAGDSMIGMYRYIKNGKVQMYEFLSIEMVAEGPILRLRHFNPGLLGWEEKDHVYSYPLISLKSGEAVFELPDKATRMTFRSTSKETLEVTLERTGRKPEVFQYANTDQ